MPPRASESQVREKLAAKTDAGDMDEIANVKAQIARAEAQLKDARWRLEQTVYRAPANGTVVSLALRPGAMAVPLPLTPAMSFVEDEQWIMAIFKQNEVRRVKPGQEAEIAMKMYPGRIIKCKVDSIMWATAQGQLPIGGASTSAGVAPIPPYALAVRLLKDRDDKRPVPRLGRAGIGRDLHRQRRADPHPAQSHPAGRHEDRLADPETALTCVPCRSRRRSQSLRCSAAASSTLRRPRRSVKQALPTVALDGTWRADASVSAEPVQHDWLHTFNDPQLDALVSEAILNNPDLRVAGARVEQAAQYLVVAQASLRPWVGVFGTGGAKTGGGGDSASALQALMLFASWELDLWGRLRYARNAAEQDFVSAAGGPGVRTTVAGSVHGQGVVHRHAAHAECRTRRRHGAIREPAHAARAGS